MTIETLTVTLETEFNRQEDSENYSEAENINSLLSDLRQSGLTAELEHLAGKYIRPVS